MSTKLSVTREPLSKRLGTSLAGYITGSVEQLTKRFGQPYHLRDHDKITLLWVLSIGGVIVTIYDYKQPPYSYGSGHRFHVGSARAHQAALFLLQQVAEGLEVTAS